MDVGTVNTVVGIAASSVATLTGIIAIKEHLKKKPEQNQPAVKEPVTEEASPKANSKTSAGGPAFPVPKPAKVAAPVKGVTTFENDESGYAKWLMDNPNGFVVNSYRKPDVRYMPLHRATCSFISKYTDKTTEGAFTARDFIKICSNDRASLNEWAKQQGKTDGPLTSKCYCKPNDG